MIALNHYFILHAVKSALRCKIVVAWTNCWEMKLFEVFVMCLPREHIIQLDYTSPLSQYKACCKWNVYESLVQ